MRVNIKTMEKDASFLFIKLSCSIITIKSKSDWKNFIRIMRQIHIENIILVLLLFLNQIIIIHGGGEIQKDEKMSQRATDLKGNPLPSLTASQTVGRYGNILLQDIHLVETLAHFDRERIPERPNHGKGAGAFGYFKVKHDITKYTKAKFLNRINKKTKVLVRFSLGTGESGYSDMVQAVRGFAVKFYTEDGNWNLVGNSFPVFQVRDPTLFPLEAHARKRNPKTHLYDSNAVWDFDSIRPETIMQTLYRSSGLARPDGYRHMDGHGIHTFKFVNIHGKPIYCKFHWKTNQGIKNLTNEQAAVIDGRGNYDYAIQDLYDSIENKKFPSWTLHIQIMTFKQASTYKWHPFDSTKQWWEEDFPLIEVGQLILNQNPKDYFTQIEQASYSVNFIPGIEPSPDRLLHGRIFAYADALRYRLGVNYNMIQVNRPNTRLAKLKTYLRDGIGVLTALDNGGGSINYFPNSYDGVFIDSNANESIFHLSGDVVRSDTGDDDNFSQPDYLWKNRFDSSQRKIIIKNIVSTLKNANKSIQNKILNNFKQVNDEIEQMLRIGLAQAQQAI